MEIKYEGLSGLVFATWRDLYTIMVKIIDIDDIESFDRVGENRLPKYSSKLLDEIALEEGKIYHTTKSCPKVVFWTIKKDDVINEELAKNSLDKLCTTLDFYGISKLIITDSDGKAIPDFIIDSIENKTNVAQCIVGRQNTQIIDFDFDMDEEEEIEEDVEESLSDEVEE